MPKPKHRRPLSDYCLSSARVMWASEARSKYGSHRGQVICPDCGRSIKLRIPPQGGSHWSMAPRHLKSVN